VTLHLPGKLSKLRCFDRQ